MVNSLASLMNQTELLTLTNGNPMTVEGRWKAFGGQSPLVIFFNKIHPLSPAAVNCINEGTFPLKVEKGKYLLKPGSIDGNFYLILKGVIRGLIKDGSREITTWINEEGEIVGAIRNLGLKIISEEYLQALEESELIGIPLALIDHLYAEFMEANIIGRVLLEDNYRGAEERAYICRLPSAEMRYKRFLEVQPGLINRVSLKYIASYLNMTMETLSRVRSRR